MIEAGSSVALVGSSGCGKSTLLALLQRWYLPSSGLILIDDIPIEKYNVEWIRAQQSLVSQEPQLLPMSIRDNIAAGLHGDVTDAEIIEAANISCAHDFIQMLPQQYNTKVSSNQLSGGQKQRVCVARAVIRKTKILLMDEATSALDSKSEKIIQNSLDRILQNGGRTSIAIAHRLSTITNVDKIVAMQSGQVVETGSHKELLLKGPEKSLYCRLWNAQALYSSENVKGENNVKNLISPVIMRLDNEKITTEKSAVLSPQSSVLPSSSSSSNIQNVTKNEEGETVNTDEFLEDPTKNKYWKALPPVPFCKAWAYQRPETFWIVLGVLCASISGGVSPAFSILLTKFITIFYDPDTAEMISKALGYLEGFFVVAGSILVVNIIQGYRYISICVSVCFSIFYFSLSLPHSLPPVLSRIYVITTSWGAAGERFLRRLRRDAYASLISQSAKFYDATENSVGRIGARLGTHTLSLFLSLSLSLSFLLSLSLSLSLFYTFSLSLSLSLIR